MYGWILPTPHPPTPTNPPPTTHKQTQQSISSKSSAASLSPPLRPASSSAAPSLPPPMPMPTPLAAYADNNPHHPLLPSAPGPQQPSSSFFPNGPADSRMADEALLGAAAACARRGELDASRVASIV